MVEHDAGEEVGRAPQGARGLKSLPPEALPRGRKSRPARGARIEIVANHHIDAVRYGVAPRKGRED